MYNQLCSSQFLGVTEQCSPTTNPEDCRDRKGSPATTISKNILVEAWFSLQLELSHTAAENMLHDSATTVRN